MLCCVCCQIVKQKQIQKYVSLYKTIKRSSEKNNDLTIFPISDTLIEKYYSSQIFNPLIKKRINEIYKAMQARMRILQIQNIFGYHSLNQQQNSKMI